MSAALDNGLEVTALHNHFFCEEPRVMFIHIGGMGDDATLAAAVGKVFAQMKEHPTPPRLAIDPAKSTLDPARIEAVLGRKGESAKGSTRSPSAARPRRSATPWATPWA